MGYRAHKERSERKIKILKRVALCICLVFVLAAGIFAYFVPPESWSYYFHMPDVGKRNEGEMRIHFIDVGQGDCTLLELPDGKIMLVDGGNGKKATKKRILRYLNALDISVIDYLVVTHSDDDHCGSLEEVFRYKKVLNAYLPPSFGEEDYELAEVYAEANEEGCSILAPSRAVVLSEKTGKTPYTLATLNPFGEELGGEVVGNDSSVVLWVDYFGVSALLCGDVTSAVEEVLVRDDRLGLFSARGVTLSQTELVKVGHHGSKSSSSQAFLEYLGVESAVISCGKNNEYGHPHTETLNRLQSVDATVYRTDRQGHIVATLKKDGTYSIKTVASE